MGISTMISRIVMGPDQDFDAVQDTGPAQSVATRPKQNRQVFAAGELPEAIVEAVANTEMDPRHHHLDKLIKDWTP